MTILTLRKIIFFILILLFPVCGFAANIYVDDQCADGNAYPATTKGTCTGGSAAVYDTVQEAVNASSANDIIYLRGDTYTGCIAYIDNLDRSNGNETTITVGTPSGAESVTLAGGSGQCHSNANVVYFNSDYWILDGKNNLEITASSADSRGTVAISDTGGAVGVQIKDTIIHGDTNDAALFIGTEDGIILSGLTLYGSSSESAIEGAGAWGGHGDPPAGTWKLQISDSILHMYGYFAVKQDRDYWYYNKVYFISHANSTDPFIQFRGGAYSTVENCVFNAEGYNNPSIFIRSDSAYGMIISNKIINNTFYYTSNVNTSYAVIWGGWANTGIDHQNCIIQNNLFYGNSITKLLDYGDTGVTDGSGNSFYYNTKTTSSDWGTLASSGWTYSNNYTESVLINGSSTKPSPYFDLSAEPTNQGSTSNSPPSDDYDGETRGSPPDIGAFEYESGGDTTAPTVSITTSSPQGVITDSQVITGTASDDTAVTGVKWSLVSYAAAFAGSNTCTGTTAWTCTITGMSEGANNVYIVAYDAAR